jgi:asparagine synthase (glutamine-hydrolysing)
LVIDALASPDVQDVAEGLQRMSGICAVWHKEQPSRGLPLLRSVTDGLALERFESTRTAIDGGIGVGAATRYANQEVYESPDILVASDADIFNQPELRDFTGEANSGAALLAGLYRRFGAAFLEKLRGEYSVVLWDRRKRQLMAATDGFATRSLAYYENERVFMVASRIDALLAGGETPTEINPGAIANYLNYTVNLAPDTIFKNVSRVLPGHYLLISRDQMRQQRYWDLKYHQGGGQADEDTLSRKLASVLEDSVRLHCNGEDAAGLGAFLSGGTDSSTVVGMMRRIGNEPVNTFSIGFAEERFNELEYARITARAFQATHHEYLVNANDCAESIPDMVRYFDEPFGNSSAIPTYFCARLAAQNGVKTLLAGDGGDELFGGNERYLTDKIFAAYDRIPGVLRKGAVEPLLRAMPIRTGLVARARSYVRRASLPQPERFFSFNLLLDNPIDSIFEPDFVQALNGYSVLERPNLYYRQGPAVRHLDRLLYLDMKMTLADNDLLKVTRMCELAGVRPRFPFLDRDVADCAGEIPAGLKVKGTQKRYLFKRAFRDLLPAEVIQKKKQGFGIPVAVWMKTDPRMRELTGDVLLSPRTYQRGYVRRAFVENLLRRYATDSTAFYGDMLWTFLVLELWLREFADKPRTVAV